MSDFEEKLSEIQRLLAEACEHYFDNSDGHCKSSEGAISVHIPPFFWREEPWVPSIEIYSYVLGPSRSHFFKDIDEALATVRVGHKKEMAFDHAAAEAEWEQAMGSLDAPDWTL